MSIDERQLNPQESQPRIVVGIDGSEPSLAALEWAARQGDLTHSRLEVVLAWKWPVSYGWVPAVPSDFSPAHDALRVVEDAIVKARIDHPDLDMRPIVTEGNPAPVLVRSSLDAELLVVGSRGHGEFVEMLLGSVSDHCITHAHCSVVVVRDRD